MAKVIPKQVESKFDLHEFFFSTTNTKGVIRYGNDVFIRVSNYPKETIIGAPHSIIRHPDMPRSVFKLFWDKLKSGNAIGAYVKNLSADGSYYWVFAFAFPIEDGYLSIRFKPSSPLFQTVQTLYKEVRDFESKNDDINKSEKLLLEKIQSHGFKSYEDFMVKAVVAELNSREEKLSVMNIEKASDKSIQGAVIAETTRTTLSSLKNMFDRAQSFQQSNNIIGETVESLAKGFRNLGFVSLNMTVAAAKFGDKAASLGVVSQEFTNISSDIEAQLKILGDFTVKLSDIIQQSTFRISALNSQMLMVDFFVKEALNNSHSSSDTFAEMNENKKDFSHLFSEYATKLATEVHSLESSLFGVLRTLQEVGRLVTGLEVIRQTGAIESARDEEVHNTFKYYLEELNNFIAILRKATNNVSTEVTTLKTHSEAIVNTADKVSGKVTEIFESATKLSGAA